MRNKNRRIKLWLVAATVALTSVFSAHGAFAIEKVEDAKLAAQSGGTNFSGVCTEGNGPGCEYDTRNCPSMTPNSAGANRFYDTPTNPSYCTGVITPNGPCVSATKTVTTVTRYYFINFCLPTLARGSAVMCTKKSC